MDGAYSLLNSLAQQKSQLEQSRHHAATEQISQQGLAMRRQEIAKPQAASGNLDELTSQLTGGKYTRYFAAPVEVQKQAYDQAQIERIELARQTGAAAQESRPLPAQQGEELGAIQANLDLLGYIKEQFEPEFSGPVRGRLGGWGQTFGGLSDKEIDFRTAAATYENIMTQLRSGAAVTPQEAVRLRREAPRPNDPPEVLLRKIANSEIVWKNILSRRQEALRGSGYGQVPSFQAREPAVAPTGPRLRKPPSQMTDRELLDYLEGESTLLQRMEEKEADMRRRYELVVLGC